MLTPEKTAVIDVGSNSCRMVIYERAGAALLPYFNEKATAELGRGLRDTGHLSPDGRVLALETFRRFRAILNGLNVRTVTAVATAAVREASDGTAFRQQAEAALGVPLNVLSGEDEGRMSARGVMMAFRSPAGIVADLGGSSLELLPVSRQATLGAGETYLLGPLARAEDEGLALGKRRKAIRAELAASAALATRPGTVYAVGGAWRNLASVHMELTRYPLGVAHGYTLDTKAIRKLVDALSAARKDSKLEDRLRLVAKKRYDTLLHAALVLEAVMELCGADTANISAFGLREGVLSQDDDFTAAARLLDTTALYFRLSNDNLAFGRRLHRFLAPVLAQVGQAADVLKMTCLMADAGARLHPDHRSDLVFQQVLRAPMPLLDHRDRIFAAHALACRYSFRFDLPSGLDKHVSAQDLRAARIVGTAMRLGGVFSGRSAHVLDSARLSLDDDMLTLTVLTQDRDMVSDAVRRRHEQLASLLNCQAALDTVDAF